MRNRGHTYNDIFSLKIFAPFPAQYQLGRQRLGGSQFKASPDKKLLRPSSKQIKTEYGDKLLLSQLCRKYNINRRTVVQAIQGIK
jgi:hypothetical protein